MTDKKPTDKEIVKALDICSKSTNGCSHSKYTCEDCYLNGQPMCSSVLLQDAIDCFNRLQAENDRLTIVKNEYQELYDELKAENEKLNTFAEIKKEEIAKLITKTKAEAYKECIEKVKEIIDEPFCVGFDILAPLKEALTEYDNGIKKDLNHYLDNLLKELVGDS